MDGIIQHLSFGVWLIFHNEVLWAFIYVFFTYRSFSFVSEEDGLKGVLMLLHWLLKFSDDKGNCFRVLNTGLCVFKVQRDTAGKFPLYRCWVTQQAQLYERLSSSSPKRFTILFFH